jgi:type I restriction enzyme S subunit
MYCLRHDADSGALQEAFTGTTIKHLTRESLSRYEIPLPPINEQKRIADKLDTILAWVDTCRERLDRVPAILKRFRQAVLADATAGALTEEWREDEVLPAWDMALLGDLIFDLKNGLSPKPAEQPPGDPILRISSVRHFQVNQSDVRYLKADADVEAYRLQPKDLLFTRYNGSLEFVGVCAMVRQVQLAGLVYPDKLIRVRANPSLVLPEWVEITVNSPAIRAIIETTARTSAGQTGIAGRDLKALVIPLPSLREQAEIVRRVATLFAYADRLEVRYTTARTQVERLTPALLAKAFRGELVPQDPNDEPASVLLERICASRAAAGEKLPRKVRTERTPMTITLTTG